jgi:hypothetical protein
VSHKVTFRQLVDTEYVQRGFTTKLRWKCKIHLESNVSFSALNNAYSGSRVDGDTVLALHEWCLHFWPRYRLDVGALTTAPKKRKSA